MCITKLATSLAKWQMVAITYRFMEIVHAILMLRANISYTSKKKNKWGGLCKAGCLSWNCYITFYLLLERTKLFLFSTQELPWMGLLLISNITLLSETTSVYKTIPYKHQYFPVISREERWALISITPFFCKRISIHIESETFNAFLCNKFCNTKI